MSGNNIGLNAGVPNLAAWPNMATQADITAVQAQIAALPTPSRLAADVTNSNSAAPVDIGFSIPVVSGTAKTIRLILFIVTGNTGGIVLRVNHPAATLYIRRSRVNTSGVTTVAENISANPASPDSVGGTTMTYTGSGLAILDINILASANGNVTFDFAPVTNTQLMTIRAGSYAQSL